MALPGTGQIRPYGAGFGQYDDFFKAAKVGFSDPKSSFIFHNLSTQIPFLWAPDPNFMLLIGTPHLKFVRL
jgi:hypothetical protein